VLRRIKADTSEPLSGVVAKKMRDEAMPASWNVMAMTTGIANRRRIYCVNIHHSASGSSRTRDGSGADLADFQWRINRAALTKFCYLSRYLWISSLKACSSYAIEIIGGRTRTRTLDPLIESRMAKHCISAQTRSSRLLRRKNTSNDSNRWDDLSRHVGSFQNILMQALKISYHIDY
jgi:hypothetical protein